jgi:competence protein ComEC
MFWRDRPFLRLLLFFAAGILAAREFSIRNITGEENLLLLLAAVTLFAFFTATRKTAFRFGGLTGAFFLFALFLAGFAFTVNELRQSEGRLYERTTFWEGQLVSEPVRTARSVKFRLEIFRRVPSDSVLRRPVKVLARLQTDSLPEDLHLGRLVVFEGKMSPVAPPANPDEFDYRRHLQNQGIRYQVYLHPDRYLLLPQKKGFSLTEWFGKWRNRLLRELHRQNLTTEEYSVAAAILLGYDQLIDPGLHQDFTTAGAVHILCVSGMHVGIIFLIFGFLFSFLLRFKYGKQLRDVLLLLVIWAYAFLTGLSPSVSRAATMITLFLIADMLHRQTDPFNILAASAFLLLTIHPLLLFDAGFQLSYAAVAGILLFYFPLYRSIYFPYKIWRILWAALAISFSAQLGAFAIAAHYFHQFPLYFLLTNLAVFGLSYLILSSGMAFLFFFRLPPAGHLFAWLLGKSTGWLIFIVRFVSNLPHSAVYDLYFPWPVVVLIFLCLGTIYTWLVLKERKAILPLTLLVVIMAGIIVGHQINLMHQHKFIVYSLRHQTAIDLVQGKKHLLLVDTATFHHPQVLDYSLKNNRIALGLKNTMHSLSDTLHNERFFYKSGFGAMRGFRFFVTYPGRRYYPRLLPKVPVDAVICRPPWRTTLQEISKSIRFRYLILETALPRWSKKKILSEAKQLGIKYYDLSSTDAFVLDLRKK